MAYELDQCKHLVGEKRAESRVKDCWSKGALCWPLIATALDCMTPFFVYFAFDVDMTFGKKLLYCSKTPTQQPTAYRM